MYLISYSSAFWNKKLVFTIIHIIILQNTRIYCAPTPGSIFKRKIYFHLSIPLFSKSLQKVQGPNKSQSLNKSANKGKWAMLI
jgi:hypothetical protein